MTIKRETEGLVPYANSWKLHRAKEQQEHGNSTNKFTFL
jgi:hypothetical protein